jgi:hypothetical protein
MKNVSMSMDGMMLVIKVDMSQRFGKSASGKTTIIASSEGNVTPPGVDDPNVKIGINVYTK